MRSGTMSGGVATAAAVHLPRRKLIRALLATTIVLSAASLAVQISEHALGHGGLLGVVPSFDMLQEANIPSWFSGVLLLACAAAFGLGWATATETRDPDARGWAGLAVVFAVASVDEVAAVHEKVGEALNQDGREIYLLPGSLLVLGVAFVLRGFFARLPDSTRRPLVVGIGIWAFGAIVLELVEVVAANGASRYGLGLSALNTLQDFFEMLGLVAVLDALARHAHERGHQVTVDVT